MSEQALMATVCQQLVANYSWLPPEQVADVVQVAYARFAECRVREFVPLLVERRARAELAEIGAPGGGERWRWLSRNYG